MEEAVVGVISSEIIPKGRIVHDFHYHHHRLYCEGVPVRDIAEKVGTPCYVYSFKTFIDHLKKIQRAFQSVRPLICYSMKACSNIAILRALVKAGAGLDIVSGGELFRAKKVKCPASRIVYAGVGKTDKEIEDGIDSKILLFNVESLSELERLQRVAARRKRKVQVSLRVNPDVDAETHAHITTGKKETKFGIDFDTARLAFMKSERYPNLLICGIHVHIGSQIVQGDPFVKAFRKTLIFVASLEQEGHKIRYLNLGGGMGIIYQNEKPQTADEFAKNILPLFEGRREQLILEPGRFIAGNGGIFVSKVIQVKKTAEKNFAIVDGAMNDLIRPALYGSRHEILSVDERPDRPLARYDVVGPVCESGDFLAKDRDLTELQADDLIAVASAGAYGFSMSSNYNSRPRSAEVLVSGSRFSVIRKRETYHDLVRGEKIPSWV